jgi:hypothetical protein
MSIPISRRRRCRWRQWFLLCRDTSFLFSFYEYLAAVFGTNYNQRIKKKVPQIQWDRTRDQMKTWIFDRKVINPILSKRIISSDKITTFPLRRANGDLI